MSRLRFLLLLLVLGLTAFSPAEEDPRIARDDAFPDPEAAVYHAGEITLVEHVNRRGSLRLDRDGTINKYLWDLPHEFQMLPYGAIYYRGAPAALVDIPIGTHLHGLFYLGPEGEYEVKNPETGYAAGLLARPDMRSSVSPYSRVLLLEDDFSYYQRQGSGWRIRSVAEDRSEIEVERVSLAEGAVVDPDAPPRRLRIDLATRIWKGREIANLEDLAVDQVVQLNQGWVSLLGSFHQDGLCRDIWIDEESRTVATAQQRNAHWMHRKRRGIPAKVIHTESAPPGEGAKGHVTIQFHAGTDPGLLQNLETLGSVFVRVAEPTLRTYDSNDTVRGHELAFTRLESPPAGSSGLQLRMLMSEMLEGIRPGRTILVGDPAWKSPETPREEKLWPHDIRIFSVGPKPVADRDGPP